MREDLQNTPLGAQFVEGVPHGTQQLRNAALRQDEQFPVKPARTLALLHRQMNHFAAVTGVAAGLNVSDGFNDVSPDLGARATRQLRKKGEIRYKPEEGQFTLDPTLVKEFQRLRSSNN